MTDDEFEDRLRERLHDLASSEPVPAPPAPGTVPGFMWTRPRLVTVAAVVVLVVGALGALAFANRPSSSRVRTLEPSSDTTTRPSATSIDSGVAPTETSSDPSATSTSSLSTTSVTQSSTSSDASTPDCTPSDLAASTAADKPSYTVGETVTITITLRNTSDHTCVQRQVFPMTFGSSVKITEADGSTLVWRRGARAVGSFAVPQPKTLAPGDDFTWTTVQWDQHFCQGGCSVDQPGAPTEGEGGPVPAGSYRALPADEAPVPAATVSPASFEVTG